MLIRFSNKQCSQNYLTLQHSIIVLFMLSTCLHFIYILSLACHNEQLYCWLFFGPQQMTILPLLKNRRVHKSLLVIGNDDILHIQGVSLLHWGFWNYCAQIGFKLHRCNPHHNYVFQLKNLYVLINVLVHYSMVSRKLHVIGKTYCLLKHLYEKNTYVCMNRWIRSE